ncbi:MAG: T9SS type A sorting domain-containing protein, partial [Candidatus Cloacimonetes bacterium]|nr:T9SS type A sorting domain-containing protein [Candidatus Cloacimonadota bacterium]
DGGDSWIQLASYGNMEEIYVDHHAMYIDENSGLIIEGNDGGLYLSENYGEEWEKIDNIPLTQFYTIEIDKNNPERIYGGTQDNNTIRTMTGALDDWERILGGDGFYCLVDHTNPMIIYAESQYGNLNKSTNGGNSFYSINAPMSNDRTNWSSPLVMDPIDSSILYFGTYRVWKSTNSGVNWTPVSEDLTQGDDGTGYHTISTLAISPLNTDIIIAGTDDGRAHISTDGGTEWTEITSGIPDLWVTRVKADPFDVDTVYLTVSGFRWDEPQPHVLKSINLGQDWEDISSNLPELPVNCMVLDPENANRIFIGTDSGVFMTENGGDNWQSLSDGIPNVPIYDITINNDTRTLAIGTHGCSAYKINLDEITEIAENNIIITPLAQLFDNYPNPFNPETTISYSVSEQCKIEIAIYNIKGQKVKILESGYRGRGLYSVIWDGKDSNSDQVSSGNYLYKLKVNDKTEVVKKCVLLK